MSEADINAMRRLTKMCLLPSHSATAGRVFAEWPVKTNRFRIEFGRQLDGSYAEEAVERDAAEWAELLSE